MKKKLAITTASLAVGLLLALFALSDESVKRAEGIYEAVQTLKHPETDPSKKE